MKLQIPIIACLLAALPAAAFADPHNDHQSYQSSRSSAQAPRETQQAPRYNAAPQQRYNAQPQQRYNAQPQQRYNAQPQQRYNAQPQQRYNAQPQQRYNAQPQQRYNTQPVQRYDAQRNVQSMPRYQSRTYVQNNYGRGGYARRDFVVARGDVNPWYWNRGIAWAPSPAYWGGGFWGAFGINLAFNDPGNGYYQVASSSPGSQLLANYGLTQTDCNQPNLVDIIGPDGSQICAYPNDQVGPGQYNVDPSTLSLISG